MKKILFVCMFSIFGYTILPAQTRCISTDQIPDLLQRISDEELIEASNNYVVRIFIHIIRHTNGSGGQTFQDVNTLLNILATDFENVQICISLLGIDEILSDTYYGLSYEYLGSDLNGDGKFDLFSPNPHSNAIDIYLFPVDGGMTGGNAANLPATSVAIGGMLFNTNLAISRLTSHEVGHCLGLYHTFLGTCGSGISCLELVDGSNCSTCGDFVCDTPADPINSFYNVDSVNCTWDNTSCTFSSTDANGDPYVPPIDNIMCYSPPDCMTHFTSGQGDRMRLMIANSTLLQNVIVPNSLTISSLTVGSGSTKLYDVLNDLTVQTSVTVQSGGTLTLRAGESIYLQNDFSADNSSSWHAYIDNTCSTIDANNSAKGTNLTNIGKKSSSILPVMNIGSLFGLKIYPNPANRELSIGICPVSKRPIKIEIISSSGIIVKSFFCPLTIKTSVISSIDISNLISGVYFLQVSDGFNFVNKTVVIAR